MLEEWRWEGSAQSRLVDHDGFESQEFADHLSRLAVTMGSVVG